MKKVALKAALVLVVSLGLDVPAQASPLWVNFEGTLTLRYDAGLGTTPILEAFSGQLVFDIEQPAADGRDDISRPDSSVDYFGVSAITTNKTELVRGSFPSGTFSTDASYGELVTNAETSSASFYSMWSIDGDRARNSQTELYYGTVHSHVNTIEEYLTYAILEQTRFNFLEFALAGTLDDGVFSGQGIAFGGTAHITAFGPVVTPVPEPGTLFLVSGGVVGLAAKRSRWRGSASRRIRKSVK
jgi:hypothetical protein